MANGSMLRFVLAFGIGSVCPSFAHAQTFAERFAPFGDATTEAASTFAGSKAGRDPAVQGRNVGERDIREREKAARAAVTGIVPLRPTIFTATAYAAPEADGAADADFSSWQPRLLPSGIGEASAVEPSIPQPPLKLRAEPTREAKASTFMFWSGRQSREVPAELAALIAAKAHKYRVPIALAHAVVTVESNYNPKVVGGGATLGLMQIKYPTAKLMGFRGTAEALFDPATNLEWGMRYLAGARKLAKGDICGTILRYQAGHRAVAMTPHAAAYCAKVRALIGGESKTRLADGALTLPR